MSEEPNRREAELNEQELEGVSGGSFASETASNLCARCHGKDYAGTCNRKHQYDLLRHLEANGLHSVNTPTQCPYYDR